MLLSIIAPVQIRLNWHDLIVLTLYVVLDSRLGGATLNISRCFLFDWSVFNETSFLCALSAYPLNVRRGFFCPIMYGGKIVELGAIFLSQLF